MHNIAIENGGPSVGLLPLQMTQMAHCSNALPAESMACDLQPLMVGL